MNHSAIKLLSGLSIDWDPEKHIDGAPVYESADTVYKRTSLNLYDNLGPCWQFFSTGNLYFFRNLYPLHKDFCHYVVDQIKKIQDMYRDKNQIIYHDFTNYEIIPNKVTVVKIPMGARVPKHVDARKHGINIGLKNSNIAETRFYFDDGTTEKYVMNDGDVYFLNTNISHSVEPLVKQDKTKFRYLVTYTC